jgi:hypothetical protein
MARARTPKSTETDLLLASRRRCALCFGLNGDHSPKNGQIAHIDRDASNPSFDNLAWLCLNHHDDYDTRRSQSKGFTPDELRRYRDETHSFVADLRAELDPGRVALRLSEEGVALAELLSRRSRNGYKLDPQIRIDSLAAELNLADDDIELAVDELQSLGLLEVNGSRDVVFATNRLFWETDPLFYNVDPAADAETVARALVSSPRDQITMAELADLLQWPPRRLNPAASYLVETENAGGIQTIGSAPYWYYQVWRTTTTKRLVRDLDRNNQS